MEPYTERGLAEPLEEPQEAVSQLTERRKTPNAPIEWANLLGDLKKPGGQFEVWGNALGEPHVEQTIVQLSKLKRKEKEIQDKMEQEVARRVFNPTLEDRKAVEASMVRWIDRWMVQYKVDEEHGFGIWSKMLGNLQSYGRPRLYGALDEAVTEYFLGKKKGK
ncbi:MAG: hypothetical protein WC750_01710 [Patescibacteria group bacterium]|jgi:hypothetical protein